MGALVIRLVCELVALLFGHQRALLLRPIPRVPVRTSRGGALRRREGRRHASWGDTLADNRPQRFSISMPYAPAAPYPQFPSFDSTLADECELASAVGAPTEADEAADNVVVRRMRSSPMSMSFG
jgi:hypothetical protein